MKILLLIIFCITIYSSYAQNVAINATGNPAVTSAALDIDATNKGILIPRVALTSTLVFAPVTGTPTESLLIYNTATNGIGAAAVSPGFYYWDGLSWIKLGNDVSDWRLTGNSGTNSTSNFLGTTDNTDLSFRTNNLNRLRVCDNGNINIDPDPIPLFPRIGKGLIWSGSDVFSNSAFNSDVFAIYRYDSIADNSTLRIAMSDNPNSPTFGLGDRIQFGNSFPPNIFNPTITINGKGDLSIGRSHAISRLDVTGFKQSPANGGNGTSSDFATQAIITAVDGVSRANDWPNAWMGGISTWDICGASTYFSGYFTRSDSTLKKEIRNMDQDVFERFFQLRPVTYNLKSETPELNGKQYGFIAQEVGGLFPTLVTTKQEESGTIGMNYQGLIAPTIYVVQQQQKQIAELIETTNDLKKIVEKQHELISRIINENR